MLDYFRNFRKLNLSKISRYTVAVIVLDVDECLTDNGGCTQICDNIAGSYQCSYWDSQ